MREREREKDTERIYDVVLRGTSNLIGMKAGVTEGHRAICCSTAAQMNVPANVNYRTWKAGAQEVGEKEKENITNESAKVSQRLAGKKKGNRRMPYHRISS